MLELNLYQDKNAKYSKNYTDITYETVIKIKIK